MKMKKMMRFADFIDYIEKINLPFWGFVIEMIVVFAVRDIVEVNTLHYHYDFIMHIHALLYFFYVISFVLMATVIVTGEKIIKVARAFSVGIPFIIPTPIIDRYIFHRTAWYDYPSPQNWADITLSFFQSNPEIVYRGHQIEFLILLSLLFAYILNKTREFPTVKRIIYSFTTTFSIYVGVMWLSTPKLSPIYTWIGTIHEFPIGNPLIIDFPYYVYIFMYSIGTLFFIFMGIIYTERNHLKMALDRIASMKIHNVEFTILALTTALLAFLYIPSQGISISFSGIDGRVNFIILTLVSISSIFVWWIIEFGKRFSRGKEYALSIIPILILIYFVADFRGASYFQAFSLIPLVILYLENTKAIKIIAKVSGIILIYLGLINSRYYPMTKTVQFNPPFFLVLVGILSLALIYFEKAHPKTIGGDAADVQ